jgi:hypothetical protein
LSSSCILCVCPMLPVPLDCPFLIFSSVFSKVFLQDVHNIMSWIVKHLILKLFTTNMYDCGIDWSFEWQHEDVTIFELIVVQRFLKIRIALCS